MTHINRLLRRAFSAVLAALCISASGAVLAQAYPSRPVNLVVTVPAGGSIDTMARLLAAELPPALGQPVVVNNRPGAGGNIAAEYVAKSSADGYTLMITSASTLVLNPFLYKSIPFDPVKSFEPIVIPAKLNMILVAHPKTNATNIKELVASLKSQSATSYGSSGNGTLPHLAGVLFSNETGTQAVHIPYKGIAPSVNDLLAGQIDYMFDSASTMPHIRTGKVRALAVIGPNRLPSLPEVATFRELGMPGMEAASGWYGIFAPAGTSREIVQRLNQEIVRILRKPAIRDRVSAMGLENATSTPEELAAAIRDDLRRFDRLVKQANVTPE